MKTFLAVFIGKKEAMEKWNKLPESEQKALSQKGMKAWGQWVEDHSKALVQVGCPLGKTKKIDKGGISDFKNEICAYNVVQAESHEAAAKLFLNHPHFTYFPGDSVELLECLPIPTSM
jgi:hypothetical protein